MKTCPFCGGEIRNTAIRCMHCDGDIASLEAVLQDEAEDMDETVSTGLLIGLIGAAAFLYGAYYYWSYGQTYTALAALGGSAIFLLITNFAWIIGKEFVKSDIPEAVHTEEHNPLIEKIFLENVPIVSSMIGFIIVMLVVVSLSKFVFDENPLVTDATEVERNLTDVSSEETVASPTNDKSVADD